jgi:hypothetical protein
VKPLFELPGLFDLSGLPTDGHEAVGQNDCTAGGGSGTPNVCKSGGGSDNNCGSGSS